MDIRKETINLLKHKKSDEELFKRELEVNKCDHEFEIIKPCSIVGGYYNPPIIRCIKCGLTNKYIKEEALIREELKNSSYTKDGTYIKEIENEKGEIYSEETKLFQENIPNWFELNEEDLNMSKRKR